MINYPFIQELPLSMHPKYAPRHYMLGEDIKCHAWCVELNRIVNASEIWNLLFGEDGIDTKFSFNCVDVGCRARLILKNCHSYMTEADAQFRLYPRERHHHDCAYIVEQERKKNQLISRRRQQSRGTLSSRDSWYL